MRTGLVGLVGMLLVSACIPRPIIRQPELAKTDEKSPVKVHFRGVPQKQETLYVCMFLHDDENLHCVDYVYFQTTLAGPVGQSL